MFGEVYPFHKELPHAPDRKPFRTRQTTEGASNIDWTPYPQYLTVVRLIHSGEPDSVIGNYFTFARAAC